MVAQWKRMVWLPALILLVGSASGESLDFYQSDFMLDNTSYTNTDWGSVDLTYTGSSSVMYFNLAVNGSWQVQNIPVLSQEGAGVTHTRTYDFSLGVPSGTPVSSLEYGYSLTTSPMDTMPAGSSSASVGDRLNGMSTGFEGVSIPPLAPAGSLIGHLVWGPAHGNSGFPNQEAGVNECAPVAVSNSVQFLNKQKKLGIDPDQLTIENMKIATKWKVPPRKIGVYIDDNEYGNAWWKDKKAYFDNNPDPKLRRITTKQVTKLADLAAELDDHQDVELQGGWHTAALVGLTDLGNGWYALDVAHDTDQGPLPDHKGGTRTDTIVYNPDTAKFIGSPGFFDGSVFNYAVVECPEPASLALLALGLLPVLVRRARHRLR